MKVAWANAHATFACQKSNNLIIALEIRHLVTIERKVWFRLSGQPPGQFKLKAWLSSKPTLELPVVLQINSVIQANLP
jgi:hypothetical protein